MIRFALFLVLLLMAHESHAYIGPGAGIGFLGSLWAWLVGFIVVLMAILIWPLRWFLRRMRSGSAQAQEKSKSAAND